MKYVIGILEEDVQGIAESRLGRRLTDDEMFRFKGEFNLSSWVEDVEATMDLVLEEIEEEKDYV